MGGVFIEGGGVGRGGMDVIGGPIKYSGGGVGGSGKKRWGFVQNTEKGRGAESQLKIGGWRYSGVRCVTNHTTRIDFSIGKGIIQIVDSSKHRRCY